MEMTCLCHARLSPVRSFSPSPSAAPMGAFCAVTHQQSLKETRIEEFEAWLRGMGHNPCNLRLQSSPPGSMNPGYGAVAGAGGIRKGEVVVQAPLESFMSELTARACPHVGPVIKRAGLTAWQGLCLHLLYERARGTGSRWQSYLALLPTELEMVELHPLMWPPGTCQEWLAGSPMLSKMAQRFLNCKEDYEVMLAAGANKLSSLVTNESTIVTELSIKWAASVLLSRAFSLDLTMQDMDDDFNNHTTVLVPWADMLNHSSSAGKDSCLTYNASKQAACLHAHKNYQEGEQVFDSYGPSLSPCDLLLDYGFVDHENNNHRVDLPAMHLGPVRGSANDALLKAIGLPPDGAIFSITESGVDDSALAWTRVAVASSEELAAAGWSGEIQLDEQTGNMAALSMAHFYQPVSPENESEALRRLLSACGNVLTQYPTFLNEDVDTSTGMVQKFAWAHMQVQRAIISEKKSLRVAWKKLYVMSKKLENRVQAGKPLRRKGKSKSRDHA